MNKTDSVIDKADRVLIASIRLVAYLIGGALVLAAFAVLGWQLFMLAKTGAWAPYSLADGLFWLTGIGWFSSPNDWLGVQAMLAWLNLPLVAFICGAASMKAAQSPD